MTTSNCGDNFELVMMLAMTFTFIDFGDGGNGFGDDSVVMMPFH